jgi:hypothetical protein
MIDEARALERSNPADAILHYEAARSVEIARRNSARRAGIFAEHEIATDEINEIRVGLERCMQHAERL